MSEVRNDNLIVRELKNHRWTFDLEKRELTIEAMNITDGTTEPWVDRATIDKVRMFSLFRFLIRVSQRLEIEERKKRREAIRAEKEKAKKKINQLKLKIKKIRGRKNE